MNIRTPKQIVTEFIMAVSIMVLMAAALLFSASANAAAPVSRIKDLADIEGVRSNMLIGYGLVVGLAGTGDSANSIPFTRQTLINMLERLGVNAKDAEANLKMKNVAAVMVTSSMDSFARQGSKIDVITSSLGDSKSLEGGMLVATPLMGADGNTYAVAQGSLVVGGFTAEGKNGSVSKNHTTVARIADGAIVERETGFELAELGTNIRLMLREPDFTTAQRMKNAINKSFKMDIASATDHSTIDIALPERYKNEVVAALDKIEKITVQPDTVARVVIDEKTGTIVMGENVRIADVAISHANLTILVSEISKPVLPELMIGDGFTGEFAPTETKTDIKVEEGSGHFQMLETGASLATLVNGLNKLGVKPRDVISILQNLKAAGAMSAELVVL